MKQKYKPWIQSWTERNLEVLPYGHRGYKSGRVAIALLSSASSVDNKKIRDVQNLKATHKKANNKCRLSQIQIENNNHL